MASVIEQPIRERSMNIVVYGGNHGYSAWGAMTILTQSIYSLAPDGLFMFYPRLCPRFGGVPGISRFRAGTVSVDGDGHLA